MTRYAAVQALARGLRVLRALNAMQNGRATSQQLAEATGLHRTTVRRLLETLASEGLVRRSSSDDSFRLALAVRGLSEGFTGDELVATVAPPIMGELLRRVVWPSDLTTPDGDAMIVRETTHRFSPLSFHRSMVGRRFPILLTASGRAYFCHCDESRRQDILDLLRNGVGGRAQQALASDPRYVSDLVARVRARGYAENNGDWTEQNRIGAIAVPLVFRGEVLGCLNVVYLAKAVTTVAAVERFLGPLGSAAAEIVSALGQAS